MNELKDLFFPQYGICSCPIVNDYCVHGYKYSHPILGNIYWRDGLSPKDAAKEIVARIFKADNSSNRSNK